ncbi:MAG: exodeoxyribonuclease VII large subunit [Lachnospiraceae bacterium]
MMTNVYSVSQVNRYIHNMFGQDFLLQKLYVKGEISNCKYHSSGHIYFTLKDEGGCINAVMFASSARTLQFKLKEGQNVVVLGSVEVYEKTGVYQMYARQILLDGEGVLYQRFSQLKKELEEMGMFAEEYKKPIPQYIHTLGVVTASTGAAIQDIINISHRRNPFVQLILYPAQVQGEGAAQSIAEGIRAMEKVRPDVIIVGRGGGSMEDLWAFNEEEVARAIFECSIPIISAVGHETDTTIADYVADLRAPTPSAAAELAVFDVSDYLEQVQHLQDTMTVLLHQKLSMVRNQVLNKRLLLEKLSPENQLNQKRQTAIDLEEELLNSMKKKITDYQHRLSLLAASLEGLSPLRKLGEGLSYVEDVNGRAVNSLKQVTVGQKLVVHVVDGDLITEVLEKTERNTDGRKTDH